MLVEQLWYTWTTHGLERAPGFQARAASDGLRDVRGRRYAALKPYLSYELPPGIAADTASAPIGLALLGASEERVLLQKAYIGADRHGRPGNFFVHALVGDPAALTLSRCLRCWRAPFWQRSDVDLAASDLTLPLLEFDDASSAATGWEGRPVASPSTADVRYVIEAVLSLTPGQHLYLAAPPDNAVALLDALARALPATLQRDLTFSAYERDVLRSPAMIVATCWSDDASIVAPASHLDLPEECYRQGPALNCYSGRRAPLRTIAGAEAYAEHAEARRESGGEAQELRSFLDLVSAVGISSADELLRAFACRGRRAGPSAEMVGELLEDPKMLAMVLPQPAFRTELLAQVVRDPARWHGNLVPALTRVRELGAALMTAIIGDALVSLASEVGPAVVWCVERGEPDAAGLLDELARAAAPDSDPERCANLAARFGLIANGLVTGSASVPIQRFVLQVAARAEPRPTPDAIKPWLRTTWQTLPELLTESLPDGWRVGAAKWLIVECPPGTLPPNALEGISQHSELFARALFALLPRGEHRQGVTAFVLQLGNSGYLGYQALVERLLVANVQDADFFRAAVDPMMTRAAGTSDDDLLSFVERTVSALIDKAVIGPGATNLSRLYLERMSAHRCTELPARKTFHTLRTRALGFLPTDQAGLLRAWEIVAGFLASPIASLDASKPERLSDVATAIVRLTRQRSRVIRTGRDAVGGAGWSGEDAPAPASPPLPQFWGRAVAATSHAKRGSPQNWGAGGAASAPAEAADSEDKRRAELLEAVARALASLSLSQEQLARTLDVLGPPLAGNACNMLRRLFRALPLDDPDGRLPRLVTYIRDGLSRTRPACNVGDVVRGAIEQLDTATLNLADHALQDEQSLFRLTGPALREWQQLVQAVRPLPVWKRWFNGGRR
mgnify:CR=1 FL=1